MKLSVDGAICHALVDSGCSHCIVHAPYCASWTRKRADVMTMSGERQRCEGVGRVQLRVCNGDSVVVDVYVVDFKPLGFEFILRVNGISALGGVTISPSLAMHFGSADEKPICAVATQVKKTVGRPMGVTQVEKIVGVGVTQVEKTIDTGVTQVEKIVGVGVTQVEKTIGAAAIEIDEPDFCVLFDASEKAWTVTWKWSDDAEPDALRNRVTEYAIPTAARSSYEEEIQEWIANGWLEPYDDKKMGPAKGLIPLMAIFQQNKDKVRPVMDFRELNSHVDAFTANADVCADKIREWRRLGTNVAIVDLRRAYLQIRVHESLWPYQTVIFRGQRYCLTRLGFGFNVAPSVMKSVLTAVLTQDETVDRVTSSYLDDIFVNEDVVSVQCVEDHLLRYGLECKPAERVADGARVLGLEVWGEREELRWKRNNAFGEVPNTLTRRSVFSFCGKLIGHLPVCGWLRVATAFMKRRANSSTSTWDEEIHDESLRAMLGDTVRRVKQNDPAKGRWDVAGDEATVWVDASSLALGIVIEVDGHVVEDASWLRPEDSSSHINMAELDAVIKGVNAALAWKLKKLHVRTDSLTVYHWISNALSGKVRLKTKASSEMLIRRRVDMIKALVDECGLTLDIELVRSECNRADALTRVSQTWLGMPNGFEKPAVAVCGGAIESLSDEMIARIHEETGHYGIKRTLYFSRKLSQAVTKKDVRRVVKACQVCQSIDPAPVKWPKGKLNVDEIWHRVGMDVTHVNGGHYLTLIDCGPTRFAVWRRMQRQDTESVIQQLESVFFERGAQVELLTDNDPAFRSGAFMQFAERWALRVRFRCAYVASGSGIAERCHRSVKRIATRKRCTIAEAVYWYNVAPNDDVDSATAPANKLYNYEIRVLGIDRVLHNETGAIDSPYDVGDSVWVKPPEARCHTKYKLGTVTKVVSEQTMEVDGMPRHVRDLRSAVPPETAPTRAQIFISDDEELPLLPVRRGAEEGSSDSDGEIERPMPRRSGRAKRFPDRYGL